MLLCILTFFSAILVGFYERKMTVQRRKKSSRVELKCDNTKLPTQMFERQETCLEDQ